MFMLILGTILVGVAIALFFVQRGETNKAFNLQSAQSVTPGELHTMSAAIADEIGKGNWREYVKVWGQIQCDRPLRSPLKQADCVSYKMSVTWEYEETVTKKDEEGKTRTETEKKTQAISTDHQSIPFMITDPTGQVEVNSEDADDVDMIQTVDDFQPNEPRGGMLSYGDFALDVSSYSRHFGRRTLGYRYRESILPHDRKALVVGTASDHTHTLVIQKPLESRKKFMIALKNDEVLTAKAKQRAQNAFYGMIACGLVGGILLILGLIAR